MQSCQVEQNALPDKDRSPASRRRWQTLAILLLLAIGAICGGWKLTQFLVGANLHTVVPGRVYRSAQLSPATLEQVIARYGIRTVINLRGCCPCTDWYQGESETTCRMDICQEDINFSAERLPSDGELRRLIDVLNRAKYPVLIHCRRGADRTGLASAIVMLLDENSGVGNAYAQLGIYYGHVALGKTVWMGRFLQLYQNWLKEHKQKHSPQMFRHWARQEYPKDQPYRCIFEHYEKPDGTFKTGEPIPVQVRVRNAGTQVWRFRPIKAAGVHLLWHLIDHDGSEVNRGRAGYLDAELAPGETIELMVPVTPIEQPGRYTLVIDMAHEQVGEFYQMGSEPLEMRLEVREK